MIDPTTTITPLPAPLTQQEVDVKIFDAKIKLIQSKFLMIVLTLGLVYNLIALVYLPVQLDFHVGFSQVYGAVLFLSFISIYSECDITGASSTINKYTPINSIHYQPLLELKNKHKPIADYIEAVNTEGREIVNFELNLFKDFDDIQIKNKEIIETEKAKAALYSN